MNRYKIQYYNSGGYKATGSLETELVINKDANNQLCLFDGVKVVGKVEEIEAIFLEQLGYVESIMVFDAKLVTA